LGWVWIFRTDLSFGSVFGFGSGLFSDLDQIWILGQNWVLGNIWVSTQNFGDGFELRIRSEVWVSFWFWVRSVFGLDFVSGTEFDFWPDVGLECDLGFGTAFCFSLGFGTVLS